MPVISYDRLILNADIDIYLSYDNRDVGEQQAQFCATAPKGTISSRAARPPTTTPSSFARDRCRRRRRQERRHRDVADPWTRLAGRRRDGADDAALTKARNQVVAVVASNDVTAGGAIKALEKHGLAGKVPSPGRMPT